MLFLNPPLRGFSIRCKFRRTCVFLWPCVCVWPVKRPQGHVPTQKSQTFVVRFDPGFPVNTRSCGDALDSVGRPFHSHQLSVLCYA